MGLFHDECIAIVDVRTKKALSGEDLKAAEALLAAVDKDGRAIRISGSQAAKLLAEHGWAICGNKVPKPSRRHSIAMAAMSLPWWRG